MNLATAAKSLFEGRILLTAMAAAPANPESITLAELTAGVRLSKAVLRSGYRLSPTGSDTLNEPSLEDTGNSTVFGSSNYEAAMTLFRFLDAAGKSDTEQDVAYNLFTGKGLQLHLVERIGPLASVPWATGDAYRYFPVLTDDPQMPTELTGYVKFVQPLGVQGGVVLRGTVALAA